MTTSNETNARLVAEALAKAQDMTGADKIAYLRARLARFLSQEGQDSIIDEACPNASDAEREAANRLFESAYQYGDRRHNGMQWGRPEGSDESVRAAMREDHPAFDHETYEAVLRYGLHISR